MFLTKSLKQSEGSTRTPLNRVLILRSFWKKKLKRLHDTADEPSVSYQQVLRTIQLALVYSAASFSLAQKSVDDFGSLSLDQLTNIKITSFTKKQQNLSQVAGAVYVITQEQIARSGLTSVPELLRLAPGVDVARINGSQWSISARGTVGAYANKLLVLIDGRSIYSPVFSGVYWDVGMPLLDEIERIEVIRGPGATIWGANAVLGVINIITKNTRDTHGTTITSSAGNSENAVGSVRMGGEIGSINYRTYAGGTDYAPLRQQNGADANDGRRSAQAGFRLDGTHKKDTWMVEGDLFRSDLNDTGLNVSLATQSLVLKPTEFKSSAANLTGEWRRKIGENGGLRVQSYFDYVDRPEPQASKVETSTWDTEVQYDFTAKRVHNLSVGGGDRMISEQINTTSNITFARSALTYSNLNIFAQDEIHLAHDSLLFTVGAKLERNYFGGWGSEPSANLLWMPSKHNSVWISAARSLRTPTLFETAVNAPLDIVPGSAATGGLPVIGGVQGSPNFGAETVKDFEAGYRGQLSKDLSVDVALFYDQFSRVRSFSLGNPVFSFSPSPHLEVPEIASNYGTGIGKGAETSIAWQILPKWKLEGSYTYNLVNNRLVDSAPAGTVDTGGKQPSRNKWRLQSYVNLSKSWNFDTFLYWTSQGSPTNNYGPDVLVPSYTRLDVRIGYKVGRHWQLSVAGQNLLQSRHLEAIEELLSAHSYVNRGAYLKSTWQF